ncbi:MerR family DNA-binding transcriptional regulator [Paenisporosarcina antarctica]|uniref:MerR family DNA-binding transcriptional regulator n=1 Tax=Paenisporosarcina antarctica TaxID=417367 RepID=A0A4P6ZXS9_9BACL|nr:MerR family DNA-binding transcriptional regulator [Paenisporosarcina antarctica]QBP41261.1 MerR family DNA-binding transcriptional regulator [Paenisporosarcina antarctica]
MYRIGLFSKISKTTIKTLRYYDEIGLLQPVANPALSDYRLEADVLFDSRYLIGERPE